MDLTATGIAAFVGIVISFSLETLPRLKTAWDKVSPDNRRPILLGLFLVAPFAILGLSCTGAKFVTSPCLAGAFTALPFYYSNLWLGLTAFVGSQFGFVNGAKTLDIGTNGTDKPTHS